MSNSTNTIQSQNTSATYERLYQVHRNAAQHDAPNQFNELPEAIRNQIYGQVYELAGWPRTSDRDWGKNNAFRDLVRLQKAIQNVAYYNFRAMPTEQRNPIALRIWINGGRPQGDANWGENHANDNVDRLFTSIIEGLGSTTSSNSTPSNGTHSEPSRSTINVNRENNQQERSQLTGYSVNDYVTDDLLDDIIRNLSQEAPSIVHSSTSTTQTTTTQTTTSTRPNRFDWGSRETTVLSGMNDNVNSSPLFRSGPQTTQMPVNNVNRNNNNNNNQTGFNDLNPVRDEHMNPAQLRGVLSRLLSSTSSSTPTIEEPTKHVRQEQVFSNDAVSDEDFERILRMMSQEESRTTPNTSTINNSSNIEVVVEDPMTERKRMAIERLTTIFSLGENAINKFEFINTVSAFDLDLILQPYARNIPLDRLVDLGRWAEIGQDKVQGLTNHIRNGVVDRYRQGAGQGDSHQYNEARAQISQLISYFEQKRGVSGIDVRKLQVQCRGVIDKMIDANTNCVDQMNSQLQDMLLDIAVDAYIPVEGDRRLGKMQCRAGQELTSHKVNILRQIILRQNQNEMHMADLEREILRIAAGLLGLNGAAFITGAHYARVVNNVDQRAQNAVNAYWEEGYRPLEFLTKEIALSAQQRPATSDADPIRKLRNELTEWAAGDHFDILSEDPDEVTETDMNAYLSKNFEAGSNTQNFDYGGEWTEAGTLFILEAAGIIRQK